MMKQNPAISERTNTQSTIVILNDDDRGIGHIRPQINSAKCAVLVVLFDVVCDRSLFRAFDTVHCVHCQRNISAIKLFIRHQ